MTTFKDKKELSWNDMYLIDTYIEQMSKYIPVSDDYDYFAIKKCIRKILEIIEKGEEDEIKESTN